MVTFLFNRAVFAYSKHIYLLSSSRAGQAMGLITSSNEVGVVGNCWGTPTSNISMLSSSRWPLMELPLLALWFSCWLRVSWKRIRVAATAADHVFLQHSWREWGEKLLHLKKNLLPSWPPGCILWVVGYTPPISDMPLSFFLVHPGMSSTHPSH